MTESFDAAEVLEILKEIDEHGEPETKKVFVVEDEDIVYFLDAMATAGCTVIDQEILSPWGGHYVVSSPD
jgi:hypothetical protein